MKRIRLGRTGLQVSRLGIGGIPLTRPTPEEAADIVRRAIDLGINLIDTARGYKDSEERIGRGIEGRRGEIVLATKTHARDRESALEALHTSLRSFGTDYLDLWQAHGVNTERLWEATTGPGGTLEAMRQAQREGKTRFIGLSTHSLIIALKAVRSGLFDTIQYQLNFISREAEEELVPEAARHDVGYLAMKPYAGGAIRDANLAMKFLMQFDNVVPIPGVEKAAEIEEMVRIVESEERLTETERKQIDEIRSATNDRFCRQCEYCMPCPQGVQIACVMYVPKLWYLWSRDRMLEWQWVTDGVATVPNCTRCGACEAKCPYGLPIRYMIVEHAEFHRIAVSDGLEAAPRALRSSEASRP